MLNEEDPQMYRNPITSLIETLFGKKVAEYYFLTIVWIGALLVYILTGFLFRDTINVTTIVIMAVGLVLLIAMFRWFFLAKPNDR